MFVATVYVRGDGKHGIPPRSRRHLCFPAPWEFVAANGADTNPQGCISLLPQRDKRFDRAVDRGRYAESRDMRHTEPLTAGPWCSDSFRTSMCGADKSFHIKMLIDPASTHPSASEHQCLHITSRNCEIKHEPGSPPNRHSTVARAMLQPSIPMARTRKSRPGSGPTESGG